MFSSRTDLPDSPYGFPVNFDRGVPGTSQVVRFTVEFTKHGPKVVAALKEEGLDFTPISIADLPPFTASSKQARVLAALQQSAIACLHGKVYFLPDPLALYKEWRADLTNPALSLEELRRLHDSFHHTMSDAETLESLLVLESGSNKLKKLPLIGKVVGDLEKGILLPQKALVYQQLGLEYGELSNYQAALACHQYSLNLAIQIKDSDLEGAALCHLGYEYFRLGEYRKAIEFHNKYLEMAQQTKDLEREGRAFNGLGVAYSGLGEYSRAIEFHNKHLEIAKQTKDLAVQGRVYGNIGFIYDRLGEYSKAIEFHEKHLEIAKKTKNRVDEGKAYNGIGAAYLQLREYKKAIEYHEKYLKITQKSKDLGDEGAAYCNLGIAYLQLEEYSKAIEFLNKDLEIAKQTKDLAQEGNAYCNLGLVHYRQKEYGKAIEFHKKDLEIAKQTKGRRSEGNAYSNLGEIYKEQGEYPLAIEAYKKSVEIYTHLQKENTEGNIQADVAFFETLFYPFRALEELFAKGLAASEVNALHEALRLADSARSRALVGVLAKEAGGVREPLSVEQMQEIAAQHQTTFLLYSCSPDEETKAWVWVIPPKGEVTHRFLDITPMKEEMKTKEERIEHLQNVRGNRDHAFVEVADWVTRGRMVVTEADLAKRNKVMKLWYESLIEPIKDTLPQGKGARLTIVPDAVFGDLPFSIFTDATGKTLLEGFTLSTVPSIQVLAYVDTINKKKEPTRDLTSACIVANPDHQLQPMLPGAEREGEEVAKLFKNPDLLMQANATLENVKAALPKAGFIHLACHGLTVDQDKKPIKKNPHSVFQGSFLLSEKELYAEDLMETPLQAQLAVLSACHSGKGSLLKEGVVGPMHALLAAGVSTVVGTRWSINDNATRLIIEKFYHFYFNETPESQKAQAQGRPFGAAEALREALLYAKQEVALGNLQSPDPYDPHFTAAWGAFFLVGLPG